MNREFLSRILRRLRPLAVNTSLLIVSTGLAVLLAEVVVRFVAPQQLILIRPDLWQPADTVGWLHHPNVDIQINTGSGPVDVFTDADGFRVSADGAVTGGRQILLLGDSFMEALQVQYEQSTAGLLEAALPETVGGPVAVRNAAVGGWDVDRYTVRARSLLHGTHFDLVIVALYVGNDIVRQGRDYFPPREPVRRYHFRLPRGVSRDELEDAFLLPANDFLEERSHLFLFIRNRMQTVRMRVGLAPLTFPPQFLKSEADSPEWEVSADLLAEIDSLGAQQEIPTLVVLVPAAFQVDSADLMRYVKGFNLDLNAIDLEQPNRILGEALAARGMRVLDPLAEFRTAHGDGEQLYGKVDPHFSPEGHRLFASLVAPVAADLLLNPADEPAEPGPSAPE